MPTTNRTAVPTPCALWAVPRPIHSSPRPRLAALSGPLHGGANEEVLKMLDVIGSKDNVPGHIDKVKAGKSS